MERGTFIGDGTTTVVIPISSAKTHIAIVNTSITKEQIESGITGTTFILVHCIASKDLALADSYHKQNNAYLTAGIAMAENYTDNTKVVFEDESITWTHVSRMFGNGMTYEWVAW